MFVAMVATVIKQLMNSFFLIDLIKCKLSKFFCFVNIFSIRTKTNRNTCSGRIMGANQIISSHLW